MEMEAPPNPKSHILMLPFLAQGHLIPFLELALQILRHAPHLTVSILNSPLNINYLRSALANRPSVPSQLHLFPLHFHHAHALPENTESLPLNRLHGIFHASTALEPPFRSFIADMVTPPLCIISDNFLSWANDVAKSFGTVNYTFTTCGAYGSAAYASIWLNLPHRNRGKSDEFSVPGFPESRRFHVTQLHPFIRAADEKDEWSSFFRRQISLSLESSGWLCNTVEEIEPVGLEILRNYIKLPVWCIGPLLPSKVLETSKHNRQSSGSGIIGQRSGKQPGVTPEKCVEWLDSHPQDSVLYISFGSQNTISETQMMELAKGLEESKIAFIWAIRPPFGFDPNGEFRPEWLPSGFENRIGNQGMLVHKWAPQLEILCHGSTGAFLSHCGWNSVLESLSQEVPLIGWPLAAEQAYNAKMLVEEMGVCVELTRGLDGEIEKEEVKRVIELVMEKQKGDEMRNKARELGEVIRASADVNNGSSHRAMNDFLSTILSSADSRVFGTPHDTRL